jgi:putative glutamine amidotransferase
VPADPMTARHVTVEEVLPAGAPSGDGPRIAVLVSLTFPDMTPSVADLVRRFTRTALHELHEQGARVHLFDTSAAPRPDPSHVATFDGVLFLGGGDADPALYGVHGPVRNLYGVDRCSDEHAIRVIRAVLATDVPLLGICRGSQLLNVACGGTLIPDLEDWALHRGGSGQPLFLDEHVTVASDSRLHAAIGVDELSVRSGHHQAVDVVGAGLRAVAWGDDGVIEAVEHQARWAIGVQWHPEDDDGAPEARKALFAEFLSRAAGASA